MRLFTPNDIHRSFSEQDRIRGRSYQNQGKVREWRTENAGARILAKVQGATGHIYSVTINIEKAKPWPILHTECTCPATYLCKHAAATLYETMAQQDRQRERLPTNQPYEKKRQADDAAADTTLKVNTKESVAGDSSQRLIYIVKPAPHKKNAVVVIPAMGMLLKNGTWSKPRHQSMQKIIRQNQRTPFLTPADHAVFRLAHNAVHMSEATSVVWHLPPAADAADTFLKRVIETKHAFSGEDMIQPLRMGSAMKAKLAWHIQPDGKQKPVLEPMQKDVTVLQSISPWYINPITHEAGPLKCDASHHIVHDFLEQGALTAAQIETLHKKAGKTKLETPLPYRVEKDAKATPVTPKPYLHVRKDSEQNSIAYLTMDYDGTSVDPGIESTHYFITEGDKVFPRKRDKKTEAHAAKLVSQFELQPVSTHHAHRSISHGIAFTPDLQASPWFWLHFADEIAPALREQGFKVEIDPNCGIEVLKTDDENIEASFTQNGEWWFSLDLGITINGQRTPLLPILVSFLRLIQTPADLERLTSGPKCYAPLPDGRHVALPSDRVRTILQTLLELFGPKPLDDKGQLRISFDLATALVRIKDFTRKRWLGEGQLKNLVERLSNFEGIEDTPLPEGLHAELRPYQKQGYDWLHFLGQYKLGGVLADDMGLGKTVQALAYILALKKKKPSGPCIVIMPTSLVTNWQIEAARFTPELKVLTLHGKDRAPRFADIENADLVLSTYPLAIRDIEKLKTHKWELVILDEAQAIKNPTSKITQAVCMLDAKQRLCLTGTPLENHLGEIWSIFAFLMPGLLSDHSTFSSQYRIPIEKHGDAERQNLLTRRLRPFILRRLKTNVAKELPSKTEIIQRVTLGDDQRDLYETVRHVMNDKVRDEITTKGFARSQIVILDALLKLRQVCCDPRLVKLAAASKATSSAKLSALMEMLPTLIEDGRRILLFSQFTSMLDLIKPELEKAGIEYVELRGTTKDRRTPITRFQKKEVPLFLISLKAGGTGLNLTAADTVIHFDPWWNPSVENQATDRAHRIGQDKPVFVYKMIADGTVEERILDLQTKKAHLASAIFGDTPGAAAALTQDDLQWLLEKV